jgi:8-oxo-dGTP diphosphatase
MNRQKAWGDTRIIPIAGCFIFNQSGKLLLIKRHRANLGGSMWGVPAGRLEPGEDALSAMTREVTEETGLKLKDPKYLGEHLIKMPHGTVSMVSFLDNVPDGTAVTLDPNEHEDFAWFDLNNILDTNHVLWGEPTLLRDFDLIDPFETDPTLSDGSIVTLLKKA